MKKHVGFIIALTAVSTTVPAYADDGIKTAVSEVLSLDDRDSRRKKIRLIYRIENVWNKNISGGIKEARLMLIGGSGFDMTDVAGSVATYSYKHGATYRYTIPDVFKIGFGYDGGAPLRHLSHAPKSEIDSVTVSENLEFQFGFDFASSPSFGLKGGVTKGRRVTYDQDKFETVANFDQSDESITWTISNQMILTPNYTPKQELIHSYTSCGDNLLAKEKLPLIMRSDFQPQVGAIYRKLDLNDGQNTSKIKLNAAWRKTNYYIGQHLCSWYTTFNWQQHKDTHHWTSVDRTVSIGWADKLYTN